MNSIPKIDVRKYHDKRVSIVDQHIYAILRQKPLLDRTILLVKDMVQQDTNDRNVEYESVEQDI